MPGNQQLQIADFKLMICNQCSLKVGVDRAGETICNRQPEIFNSPEFCAEKPGTEFW
jgi:hypothetical protein